ncbi:MAG: cytochrome C [Nitrosomonadales bacterium]|nr:cytochrome C [Nitrosomonadales bacterium]
MKKLNGLLMLALLLAPAAASAAEAHMGRAHNMADRRISLGLSPEMRQHQLANMRAHLAAVQKITGLVAEKKYDKAAIIARTQLGLTEEMKQMCDKFENEEFKALGLAFHSSGDELGEALKAKNPRKVFRALNKTLGYCVQCHEKFQQ